MATKVTVDYSGLIAKEKKVTTEVAKRADAVGERLARLGQAYAKQIAPHDSGQLIRQIKVFKGKGKYTYELKSLNTPSNRKFSKGIYPNFSLPRWMDETNGIFTKSKNPYGLVGWKHIKSGKARYMRLAKSYMTRTKKKTAQQGFDDLKIK